MAQKQIVIRVDADHQRGMGHLYRMMTLAAVFNNNGYECIFLLRTNKVAEKVLHENHYTSIITYPPELSENHIISSYFDREEPPLLWIFDILSTNTFWIEAVHQHRVAVICFDDLVGGPKAADLVINAIAGCWAKSPRGNTIVNGLHYIILPPYLNTIKRECICKITEHQIGISLGGSDTYGATVKIAQALQKTALGNLTFFLGPHFEHEASLHAVCSKLSCPFTIKSNVANLLKEMVEMDCVICNGGQTLFELCALGVPVLALANEPHEEKTIRYFAKRNACLNIGAIQNNIDFTFLGDTLHELLTSTDKMNVLKKNAAKLIDVNGALRCYEECTKLIAT